MIKNAVEWPMLSYYVIYYEKFKKVMQQTEKEAWSKRIVSCPFLINVIKVADTTLLYKVYSKCQMFKNVIANGRYPWKTAA